MPSKRSISLSPPRLRRVLVGLIAFFVFLCVAGSTVSADSRHNRPSTVTDAKRAPESSQNSESIQRVALSSVPLSFEVNQGQADSPVKFIARGDGYALYLTRNEAVFTLRTPTAGPAKASVLRMELLGANADVQVSGAERQAGTVNYFLGRDNRKWRSGIPTYDKVHYSEIYPGVDAVFYGNQRQLEYDFTVAPGADVQQIALGFSGAQPKLDADGNVVLALEDDVVLLHKPYAYQIQGPERRAVNASFVVTGNQVELQIGDYDHSQPLVIDPVISYLTYLGGSTAVNPSNPAVTSISCRPNACPPAGNPIEGQGIAVDKDGNVYVTGQTWTSNFPTQTPFQATNKSAFQWTAYVTKLNPTGTGLIYSTYLGGSVNEEADAIAVDTNGSAYVVGVTWSGDFPTTSGAYWSHCPIQGGTTTWCQSNGASFLTKLSPDGQSLVYSTYMPIENTATFRAVAVDEQGRAYVAGDSVNYGNSASPSTPSFLFYPTTPNALQPSSLVDQAVHGSHAFNPGMSFVTVFSADGSSLLYSTYFGDSDPAAHGSYGDGTAGWTHASGVAVDTAGNFYLAGYTADRNIPITANAFQTTYHAFSTNYRGYVAKFSPVDSAGGPQLIYSTFLGGTNTAFNTSDWIHGIAADASGSAYVTGVTQNNDFPTTSGSFNPGPCATPGNTCGNAAFLTKIKPDGTALDWSTFVDYSNASHIGAPIIMPPRLDGRGNVYVEVQTAPSYPASAPGYPLLNPVETPGAGAVTLGITKFNPSGSKIFFSTLLGGTVGGSIGSAQFPAGLGIDPQGSIYAAGMTNRGDLPVTVGAFQTTFPVGSQNYGAFIAKINPFVTDSTSLVITPTTVTAGQTVTFTATVDTNLNGSATGTVHFMNGDTVLGSGTLDSNGNATFSTTTLLAGTYEVTASYLGDDTFAPSTSDSQSLTINSAQAGQTITFGALANVNYGTAPITLAATASSGLPVSYEVIGPASLNGSVLTVTGVGNVSITASQPGDADYLAATPVVQSFIVAPAVLSVTAINQSITFGQPIPTFTYSVTGFVNNDPPTVVTGSPQFSTTATANSAAGSYQITISQGTLAAANYTFAFIDGTLTINGGAQQTISFGALPNVTYGVGAIVLSATASSGLPVSFTATGPATLSGSALTITGAGTVTVTASQAGNDSYAAATPISRSFTVQQAVLTVTANNQTISYGQQIPTLTYLVTGFVNDDPATLVTGSPQLSTTANSSSPAGTYPIVVLKGTLAADNYAFTLVNGTLTISGGVSQTLSFGALPNVTYGAAPITLSASASSGLPVSYSVTGPATLSGSMLTITGAGTVNVRASQPGDGNYAAATPVTQSFIVSRALLTVTASNATMAYGQPVPALSFNVTGYVNGDTVAALLGVPLERTTATSTSHPGMYPVTISEGTLAAANYNIAFVNGILTITKASQSITFNAISAQTVGALLSLSASASSGLAVSFSSSTTSVCTVSGNTARMVAAGTCTIQASQAGNTDYLPGAPVTRSFNVSVASSANFTITPNPPSETVKRGNVAAFLLTLRSVNGFKGTVKLSCSGGPAGSKCIDLPPVVYLNGTAYALFGILFPNNAVPGTYTITFTGVSGSVTATATAKFTIR